MAIHSSQVQQHPASPQFQYESRSTEARQQPTGTSAPSEAIEHLPFGILLVNDTGSVISVNAMAATLLGREASSEGPAPSCCELVCCYAGGLFPQCLTERARQRGEALPELRIDIGDSGRRVVWATATPSPSGAVISIRPDPRHPMNPRWSGGRTLQIRCLGSTRVRNARGSLDGEWLEHRTGQLLRFLVVHRRETVHAEQIAAALWPSAGLGGLRNVRQCVHLLRDRLEPGRERQHSTFVIARGGGYALGDLGVEIDVDEFERRAGVGLDALADRDLPTAIRNLDRALAIYGGDFCADEPYAEWTFAERDRLRDLAARVLRALSAVHIESGEVDIATDHLQRLALVEPLDVDVERQLIGLHLHAGRHSQAVRRYERLRWRMRQMFGEEPAFQLRDLSADERQRA